MSSAPTPLPVIKITSPCHADWESMSGDARSRFCTHCQRHVHDLSAMRSSEVADLLCRDAGSLCVRFTPDADGRPKALDYAPPQAGHRARRWVIAGAIATALAGVGGTVWKRTHKPPPMIMGGISCVAPPPAAAAATSPGQGPVICP